MALPQLVIFDCDGILVDTENMGNRRLAEWLTEAGFQVTFDYCRRNFSGRSMASVYEEVGAAGVDLGADFVERWNLGLPDLFAQGLDEVPYVRQVIEAIRSAGIAYCVATSARLTKMQLTLGTTGLLPYFEHAMFSASMVGRGKPFPDLFLHAASRWASRRATASSSRTVCPAFRRPQPPACKPLPITATRIPTAKVLPRRVASSSTTCVICQQWSVWPNPAQLQTSDRALGLAANP
jgi:beta-phosphoglucomutase-like phosphatase (HAD superfamily)